MAQILSIQSAVAFGFAGNSAAVFPLRRVGMDVWPVLTVNFSNHTGYGAWRGPVVPPADVAEVVRGVDDRGVLSQIDAVLSGYQGAPDMGRVILDAVDLTRSRNPSAIYCCDPVMGDVDRGFYAVPGIPEFMREHVVPKATIMTPNLFELEYLTDRRTSTVGDVLEASTALRSRGPGTVLVTSVVGRDASDDVMRMIAQDEHETWQVETPVIDRKFTGSGDLTTAMFLAGILEHGDLGRALAHTASTVYSVLKRTDELQRAELALVQAQDELVEPTYRFQASRL
ncbi:pyridoxal kinase PdxY [Brooklawnia cerclae]|uniref:pyridoxal kinase n=1 Tax=Brooklawnia cerclae TaxID=349934 RepID=A0ABX0SJ21_9ACTN|nr:pyridoxal kinase PdxY [Brooklawnia cerclae]NIH56752.1 pyridoxine kinase [Brooklawnia cerclae]